MPSSLAAPGKTTRATMTFEFDPQLLSKAGFEDFGNGVYQQPYFPFGSALLNAPAGFEFPHGFPFQDGGFGHDPLRRQLSDQNVGGKAGERALAVVSTANSCRFRIQTQEKNLIDSETFQTLLSTGIEAQAMKMSINSAINMHMFAPTNPLTMMEVMALFST